MEIKISERSIGLRSGGELYVCDSEQDSGEIRINLVTSGCSLNIDLPVDELQRFQRLIGDAINEAFHVQPDLRCPACGYTFDDAKMHGDHRICRRYPFFPGENGKSHAVG